MLEQIRPDLIILDLQLPDVDGLVFCSELKRGPIREVPIIACGTRRRASEGILALRLGADDFIVKPVDLHEMLARVEAVLRRGHGASHEPAAEPRPSGAADLVLDEPRAIVAPNGEELPLTPTEYRLLRTLASHPDEAVSRDELSRQAWGYRHPSQGRALDTHISRLRDKLEAAGVSPWQIVAVRGSGYELVTRQILVRPMCAAHQAESVSGATASTEMFPALAALHEPATARTA